MHTFCDRHQQSHAGQQLSCAHRRVACSNWRARQADAEPAVKVQLSLWCLNPACVFREIGEAARCVLVTSGTLAPMTSFASELGIPFGVQLETRHVVPKENVRASSSVSTTWVLRVLRLSTAAASAPCHPAASLSCHQSAYT